AVNSSPWRITRTWSVPSTTTIFISPLAISSTPTRSIRLTDEPEGSASRRGCGARAQRTGVPLRLEQRAQRVLGGHERHTGDDRLEEAEDDELAGLLGRDPAALEIEELSLVDRSHGRRVGRPPAIGLV